MFVVSHVCYVVNRREKEEANSESLTVLSTDQIKTADASFLLIQNSLLEKKILPYLILFYCEI